MPTIIQRWRYGREEASADSTIVAGATAIIEDVVPTNFRGIGFFVVVGDIRGPAAQINSNLFCGGIRRYFYWYSTLYNESCTKYRVRALVL